MHELFCLTGCVKENSCAVLRNYLFMVLHNSKLLYLRRRKAKVSDSVIARANAGAEGHVGSIGCRERNELCAARGGNVWDAGRKSFPLGAW